MIRRILRSFSYLKGYGRWCLLWQVQLMSLVNSENPVELKPCFTISLTQESTEFSGQISLLQAVIWGPLHPLGFSCLIQFHSPRKGVSTAATGKRETACETGSGGGAVGRAGSGARSFCPGPPGAPGPLLTREAGESPAAVRSEGREEERCRDEPVPAPYAGSKK